MINADRWFEPQMDADGRGWTQNALAKLNGLRNL
jgi:hypothetical protein